MFVDSMDCFLTYNLSCINTSLVQLNHSGIIFGDVLRPNPISIDESFNPDFVTSVVNPSSSSSSSSTSILVSLQHCIITALILGGIILSTITGNILVIAAVIREKSLHSVAYYLFVSLAVADLMVASMVMPIAVLKEVTRSWVLGSIICDAWVMIDLLCCTASILHLVAIALDRYWAITDLNYATKRTAGRVLILICIIWVTSILISSSHLFPIFRDKRGRPSDQCHLIGNIPFTIISTVGAFYIPLIGMCIIYWKIFQAARFRIRRRAFNTNHSTPPTLTYPPQDENSLSVHPPVEPSKSPLINRLKLFKQTSITTTTTTNNNHHHCSHDIEADNLSTYSSTASHQHDYELKPLQKKSLILLKKNSRHQQNTTSTVPIQMIKNPLASSTSSLVGSPRLNETQIILTENHHQTLVTKSIHPSSRKKLDIKRERKATKVLGVVMGCFILCWLPFFIEETICGIFHLTINEKVISVLTWLGYLNSLLNPVIYTIFAPDFRQAFGRILFGRYKKRRRLKK